MYHFIISEFQICASILRKINTFFDKKHPFAVFGGAFAIKRHNYFKFWLVFATISVRGLLGKYKE